MRDPRPLARDTLRRVGALWGRLARRRRELIALLSLLAASGGLALFMELADAADDEAHALDTRLLLALRAPDDHADPLGPVWVEELARDVTALGGTGVLAFWTLAVVGFLFLDRKPHAAWLVLFAVTGGGLLAFGLKDVFDRPRPDLVSHGARVLSASFPSAHSLMSAVAYLTLGALLARLRRSWVIRGYLLAVATFLTVAVGASRVYLGVHWPTDVLAGWSIGAAWAIVCWTAALWLQRRGNVEEDVEEDVEENDEENDEGAAHAPGEHLRSSARADPVVRNR